MIANIFSRIWGYAVRLPEKSDPPAVEFTN